MMSVRTQSEWDAHRREVKAQAAETMRANAEEARDKLAALRKGAGYPVEAPAEIVPTEDVEDDTEDEGYGGFTVEELKGFLAARDLTVSGNKAELIERLEEDDAATDQDDDESATE